MAKKVYSNLKIFSFPEKLTSIKDRTLSPPIYVRIKPTNICNHSCWYCGYQANPNMSMGDNVDLKEVIPPEKLHEICDDLIKMGTKAVTFTGGGEPLVYPKIDQFITKLIDGGISVAVITNGANLKGRIASSLAGRASWVRVSMDGWDNASYIKYRQSKDGEFDKIVQNLREFSLQKAETKLSVAFNVDKDNYHKIYEFASLMKSIKIDTLKFTGVVVYDSFEENSAYHAPFATLAIDQIEKAKAEFEAYGFEVENVYKVQNTRYLKSYSRCYFSEFLTVIGADQMVYACHDKAYTTGGELGSIKDRSFSDFWTSADARQAIDKINPKLHCLHHCTADGKNRLLDEFVNIDQDHIAFT